MPIPFILTRNRKLLSDFIRYLFFCFFFIILPLNNHGQDEATISSPRLKMVNDNLSISYDITGGSKRDKYNITIEITYTNGAEIEAKSLTGDIGDSISGGKNREIIWNLTADNIYLNNAIQVEILADRIIIPKKIPPKKLKIQLPETIEPLEKKVVAEANIKDESKEKTISKTTSSSQVNLGKHMLQSVVFPGWGLTSMSEKKTYLALGIISAGCLASSYYFNTSAYNNYNKYKNEEEVPARNLYNKALDHQTLSRALAIGAAAIWVADLGLVYFKGKRINRNLASGKRGTIELIPAFEPELNATFLSLYFRF